MPDLEEFVGQERLQDALATLLRFRLRCVGGRGQRQGLAIGGGGLHELPLEELETLEELEERNAPRIRLVVAQAETNDDDNQRCRLTGFEPLDRQPSRNSSH